MFKPTLFRSRYTADKVLERDNVPIRFEHQL